MVKTNMIMEQTNATTLTKKAISAWWMVQGAAFIILTVIAVCQQTKPPVWALTFGIILCLAAYLRRKGEELRRIADMVLLAYSISFAVIAGLLAYINAHGPVLQATLIIVAVANIAASITSLRRKTKHK